MGGLGVRVSDVRLADANEHLRCESACIMATVWQLNSRLATMTTGKKAASAASKVMRDPKATKIEKRAAASDLSQARKATPKKSNR